MCLLGIVICSASVGMFKFAMLGVDPYQSFLAGLDLVIPVRFSTISLVMNFLLLAFTFFADRHYIGIGTVFNLFLSGYIIEYVTKGLDLLFPAPSLLLRLIFLSAGIVIMAFAASLYFTADLGVSSYDSIALIITETWHRGRFRTVRILNDLTAVVLGVGLFFLSGRDFSEIGAVLGAGTVVTAFFMGPLISFFREKIARPLLNRSVSA